MDIVVQKLNKISDILENRLNERIPELMELMKDENFEVREKASNAIVFFENNATIEELLKAVATDDPNYRNSAIEALILMGEKVVPFLISELDSEDKDVRKFIVDVLGIIKSEEAVPYLMKMIDDDDDNVSQGACESLGKIGSAKAVDKLIDTIYDSEWKQFSAIEALGKIGNSKALPDIVKIMKNSNDWIKYVAIEALGNMKNEMAIKYLIDELNTENDEIINGIFFSIEKIILHSNILPKEKLNIDNLNIIADKLKGIYTNTINIDLKKSILRVASYFKLSCCYQNILYEIVSPNQEISDIAIDSIISFGDDIIPTLMNKLKTIEDDEFELEVGILYLIGEIVRDNNDILDYITAYLIRPEEEIRDVVIQSIIRISREKGSEIIKYYVDDNSGNVRRTVLEILAMFKIQIDFDDIKARLCDMYPDVRKAAANYIIKLNNSEYNNKILKELQLQKNDYNEDYVKLIIEITGKLRLESASEYIIELIENNENIIEIGISALGNLQNDKSLSYLLNKIHDKNVVIKKLIADALGKINCKSAVPKLLEMLDDEDSWVRYFTISALNNFNDNIIKEKFLNKLQVEKTNHVIIEILYSLNKYNLLLEDEKYINKFLNYNDEDVVAVVLTCYREFIKDNLDIRNKILRMLTSESWKIKNAILDLIEGEKLLKDEITKILPLIKDDNMLVKEKALSIVGFNGEISLVVPMISTMMEETLDEITLNILSNAKETDYDSLLESLNSEYDTIRVFAANAMTLIADSRAESPLINALNDENWKVRYFAIESLGNIKSQKAYEKLLQMVEDENQYVVEAALRAIRKIGADEK